LKSILLALMALLLVGQVSAMNLTESAYLKGINDGYALGYLALTGQNNVSAENEYNSMVARLNLWMDQINYTGQKWANLTKVATGYQLAPVYNGTFGGI
jgi:hypothetical protein